MPRILIIAWFLLYNQAQCAKISFCRRIFILYKENGEIMQRIQMPSRLAASRDTFLSKQQRKITILYYEMVFSFYHST